jgi:hypothetical protein
MARAWMLALLAVLAAGAVAEADEWSRARISTLPDEAFAVIEAASDGHRVRHLPHHDASGAVDLPHLRAARSRLGQVKWLDPANADGAREHLDRHWRELQPSSR